MERHLTKIVATVGPACQSEKTIGELILAGVNIFRFNFKHNTLDWHDRMIQKVNRVAMHLGARVGTLIDLQGPEIRIKLPKEKILVKKGQIIPFFTITHPQLIPLLKTGQKIIVDDGKFKFVFNKKSRNNFLISESDGFVLNKKTLNTPGLNFPLPVLIDRDFQGLHLAARNQVDYVALSFVRSADDISILRREIKKFKLDTSVIAKIETNMALKNLDKILTVSDGIMVARGDLGVEIPLEEVPYQQKIIIKKCILKGIQVITATQMLESMVTSPLPTRAEISDVANATYDLTDAVMLSGETATGSYPVQAVEIMQKTLSFNEKKNFAGFIVFTATGQSVRALSRYRALYPIFAFTRDVRIADQLTVSFGVISFTLNEQKLEKALSVLKKSKYIKKGDVLIILYPTPNKGTRVMGLSNVN